MQARGLQIALIVSLLANIFLVGVAAGGAMIWTRGKWPAMAQRGRPIRRAGDDLSSSDQARFHATISAAINSVRPLQRQARESRRTAAAMFVRSIFDANAVNAALAQARRADFATRTQLETSVVQFAATLPRAERVRLGEGLARGGPLRHPEPRDQQTRHAAQGVTH